MTEQQKAPFMHTARERIIHLGNLCVAPGNKRAEALLPRHELYASITLVQVEPKRIAKDTRIIIIGGGETLYDATFETAFMMNLMQSAFPAPRHDAVTLYLSLTFPVKQGTVAIEFKRARNIIRRIGVFGKVYD